MDANQRPESELVVDGVISRRRYNLRRVWRKYFRERAFYLNKFRRNLDPSELAIERNLLCRVFVGCNQLVCW